MAESALPSDWIRPLGATGLNVSGICVGGAPLGSMPEVFGHEVAEDDAINLVRQVFASPLRFLDTANGYSGGRSEQRIGAAIRLNGGLPPDFLVATKVDASGRDYSAARVRQSVRESSGRLGLDTLPLVYLHDPEFFDFDTMMPAVEALQELRAAGTIGHIGLAGGDVHEMARYLELDAFEVLLVHNRFTLVDRSATELIETATAKKIAVVNAAIYGGGILANGRGSTYGYRPATEATLRGIQAMAAVCRRFDSDLATVALAASVRNPLVTSTVVGFSTPSRIDTILAAVAAPLPDELFAELESLVPSRRNWLDFQEN